MTTAVVLALLAASDADTRYERELVEWGLRLHVRELEPNPEGKVVEEVLFAIEDVFSESDPWPTLLNIFHGKTREYVVGREVLLKVGDVWTKDKATETERNLRAQTIFAVARAVPVKGRAGGVGLIVVTKDRWSFRANWDFLVVGNVLEYLHVPITEINVLGQGMELTLDPFLRRDTLQLGQSFVIPRLLSTRLYLAEAAALVFNRATRKLEGSSGLVQVARPLFTLDQVWGFNVYGVWDVRRARLFRGNSVWQLGYPNETAPTERVPYVYDARTFEANALGTRRFGDEYKTDLTAGVGGYLRDYQPPPEGELTPEVHDWFVTTKLPLSEAATYLYAQARVFRAKYIVEHNIESFGLSEDYQLGPRLIVAAKWAIPTFTPTAFFEAGGSLRWRFHIKGDLLTLQGAAAARFLAGQIPINQHYAVQVTNVSPLIAGGRFVARVYGSFRERDLNNNQVVLGAGQGLRGVPSGALVGKNVVLGNVEYRFPPFIIETVHVGLVSFYDVGSAYDVAPSLVHTFGLGLRVLLPQLNSQVIRIDMGFIIGHDNVLDLDRFSATFGQVTQIQHDFFDDPL